MCAIHGVKHFAIAAYHPQTNDQTERYNMTILMRLQQYVSKYQKDYDIIVLELMYAYKMQIHRSTNRSPFSMVLCLHLPRLILLQSNGALPSNVHCQTSRQVFRARLEAHICTLRAKVGAHAKKSQQSYKQDYDRQVLETPI